MEIKRIYSNIDVNKIMKKLNVDKPGIKIMSKKAKIYLFYIKNMHIGAANILKQDALSIGADLALPNGVITCKFDRCDALLIGTKKHIEILSRKELAQPYGLKNLAKELKSYLNENRFDLKIMGVINANDDSFYPNSRFKGSLAIKMIEKMIEDGADIIDIGGVSSRPGSEPVDTEEELSRVKPIIKEIYKNRLFEKAEFSIDSFRPEVIEFALNHGFKIANDITGLRDDDVARVVSKMDAKIVIMHMKGNPKTMQIDPEYEDVTIEVSRFFDFQIKKAIDFGIKKHNIIIDPGIGFGKNLDHNIELLQNLEEFKKFGCEILVGASRKSMIDKIFPSSVEKRLPGTLALHLKAFENGANIIRCHDVYEHKQAFEVFKELID
ncbi:dihydropteroate synthase [Nitrosophilus kaiyonis]|uniref:dihydropteroate synthase n=1 Tax=Nitrosophilus kaiyonis TaxID=2930200 RepID=UPI0024918260|nr:dihydropteroate synthase [Nitrosophilus kaiyonis]